MYNQSIVDFIKSLYKNDNPVALHAPRFLGNEKKYLSECIDSTFVSYVGQFVNDFENHIIKYTGTKYAVALVNGTSALEMALLACGVKNDDDVITQSLTFAATSAAIVHVGANPIFIDVDKNTMGMSPYSLENFIATKCDYKNGFLCNKKSGKRISAVIPMHTFGHPVEIDKIQEICQNYNLTLIEDAAESLGSFYKNKHTGTFGKVGIFSFNGNKPITTGGGGMIVTDDISVAERVRYLSTTAKQPKKWDFYHTESGYNLRLPNVNAAIGCAQMENISEIIKNKRETAMLYSEFFKSLNLEFFIEPKNSKSNYWLNAILFKNRQERDDFLAYSNENGVQTRPIWILMNKLPPYLHCEHDSLENSTYFEDRVVNIPSGYRV